MKVKKRAPEVLTLPFIEVVQGNKTLFLTSMPASVLVQVSYVAVRRQDSEEGAVQRPLSERRISSIRDFVLAGGDFPACIILNWIHPESLVVSAKTLRLTVSERLAQIIDGQHRVAGLEEAIAERKSIGRMLIPVALYQQLTTQQCADIFLSINTEQKPVPKSLAYDLFGIASSDFVDQAALRAAEIAQALNESEESPYQGLVKYSGEPKARGRGSKMGIALSTIVNAVKPLVASKGVFEGVGVREFYQQTKVLMTFFTVLQQWYGEEWLDRKNALMHAAGFTGAVDFLRLNLIPYCNSKRSYAFETIKKALDLKPNKRIYRDKLEKMGGRASARKVTDLLIERFTHAKEQESAIEF